MDKMLKMCNTMIEGGKVYVGSQAQFLASLWEMSTYFSADQEPATTAALNKLIQVLQEVLKFQNLLIDQASRTITRNLTKFLKEDMKQMKETKGYFNKISNDLDSALSKNAAASKSRPADIEDASNLLTATRSCFRYTGLDYAFQISMLQARKKHAVIESLAGFVSAHAIFFQQGHQLLSELEPYMKGLGAEIQAMQESAGRLEKQLEKRHTYVTQEEALVLAPADAAGVPSTGVGKGKAGRVEGYLFKRGQNAFRTWNRRWFYLDANKLCYVKRNGEDVTIIEDDLRICLVRPLNDIDRRFCFEVISPTKSHILQADSEALHRLWMTSLQQSISSAFHEVVEPEPSGSSTGAAIQWEDSDTEEAQDSKTRQRGAAGQQRSAAQILHIPGNELCCDCSHPDPQWASINFGITLCIECGGIHRSLGVHISKVRSIQLDAWEPELLKVMAELGNNIVNKILEGRKPAGPTALPQKPGPEATRPEREAWIVSKYREKLFVDRDIFKAEEFRDSEAWTVKRLRRRARSQQQRHSGRNEKLPGASKEDKVDEEEKDLDTSEEPSLLESVLRASTLSSGTRPPESAAISVRGGGSDITSSSSSRRVLNAEVVLFGGSLGKHHVASVELDSDQVSTTS